MNTLSVRDPESLPAVLNRSTREFEREAPIALAIVCVDPLRTDLSATDGKSAFGQVLVSPLPLWREPGGRTDAGKLILQGSQ
jgi:hypothetical protein